MWAMCLQHWCWGNSIFCVSVHFLVLRTQYHRLNKWHRKPSIWARTVATGLKGCVWWGSLCSIPLQCLRQDRAGTGRAQDRGRLAFMPSHPRAHSTKGLTEWWGQGAKYFPIPTNSQQSSLGLKLPCPASGLPQGISCFCYCSPIVLTHPQSWELKDTILFIAFCF